MFCVECGKEGELFQGLCRECYLSKNVFITIPKHIDVEICAHCSARKKKKGWASCKREDLAKEIVIENASSHPDVSDFDVHVTSKFEDENNVGVSVITQAKVLGLRAKEEHETRLRFKHSVCDECSKQHGGYWEAKVQLRGSKRGLSDEDMERAIELVDLMVNGRERKDKGAFITKVEKIHNGLDFYLGSKNLGKAISKKLANEFGGRVKESHQLMGRKNGKDIYRMTYAVRLLEYRVGAFVQLGGTVHKVLSLSAGKMLLMALDTWKKISLRFEELEEAKVLGGKGLVKEMVVVSRSEKEIQVLDPDTLKTVDVLLPKGFEVGGETAKVVKCEAGYFFVGEE